MRFDDGTTNGESQAHAGSRRLTLAAGELLEYCLLSAGGQSWAVVGDSHAQLIAHDLRRQGRPAARRRVLRYILQQIDQNPLDQDGVQFDQGQIAGKLDRDAVPLQHGAC